MNQIKVSLYFSSIAALAAFAHKNAEVQLDAAEITTSTTTGGGPTKAATRKGAKAAAQAAPVAIPEVIPPAENTSAKGFLGPAAAPNPFLQAATQQAAAAPSAPVAPPQQQVAANVAPARSEADEQTIAGIKNVLYLLGQSKGEEFATTFTQSFMNSNTGIPMMGIGSMSSEHLNLLYSYVYHGAKQHLPAGSL